MAHSTLVRQLLVLGFLVIARADPSAPLHEVATNLRGSMPVEATEPAAGAPTEKSGAAGLGQTGAEPEAMEESTDLVGENLTEDALNSTGEGEGAESLIVCRGGKVCRGAWTWSGGVKVCRGGFSCRGWAALLVEDVEGEGQGVATLARADLAERDPEQEGDSFNSSDLMEILSNTSQAAQSLIVCRGARVCRGGWSWRGAVKFCRGGFSCRRTWR